MIGDYFLRYGGVMSGAIAAGGGIGICFKHSVIGAIIGLCVGIGICVLDAKRN
jgi:hypothetical protein